MSSADQETADPNISFSQGSDSQGVGKHEPGLLNSAERRAFPAVPRVQLYFPGEAIEECRGRIVRCAERGDGPAIVIGAPGMGKSLLLAVAAESLADRLNVVQIASTQLCTRRALLQSILFGLGLPYQNRDEGELRLALVSRLEDRSDGLAGTALLIDEAQALPVRLLEELRILSNLQRDGESLVRIVLAGNGALEEQFASTELEAFNQRLAARCYLAPLNYGETHQYVRAHVAAAGADPDTLFTSGALDSVYSASDGVPRLINQVCDRAILMAVDRGVETIDQALIQAAWSDLHQLPAPWHSPEATLGIPESDVVEYGVLPGGDDDDVAIEELASTDYPAATFESELKEETADEPPVIPGNWNADAALEEVATLTETVDTVLDSLEEAVEKACTDEVACEGDCNGACEAVSKELSDESLEEEFTEKPRSDSDFEVAGEAEVDEASNVEVSDQRAEGTEDAAKVVITPDVATLFGEGFDEEEVVLDRFASLQSVISPTAPVVVNSEDTGFGALVDQHVLAEPIHADGGGEESEVEAESSVEEDSPNEYDAEDDGAGDDGADQAKVFSLSGGFDSEENSDETSEDFSNESIAITDHPQTRRTTPTPLARQDTDVLIIEPDAKISGSDSTMEMGSPTVHRQEYNQLFANLRRS